jgi:1-acyl-sn-glycerol-3-phosphate acyltransferase
VRWLMRLIAGLCLKADVRGLENFPAGGPALLVTNHLGDADAALLLAALPAEIEAVGKIEMYDFPIIGKLMHWYGTIWVHRGRPDIRALRAALRGLEQGRMIVIAPEGRYSLIGGLEEGTDGAAFLAYKAGVPVVPVAMTGTENQNVYGHLRRLRRAPVTLTVGEPFRLADRTDRSSRLAESIHADTQRIMESLARLLPPEYQGLYARGNEI